jgi:glycosyltransferase involved in cell wall biosynthesis
VSTPDLLVDAPYATWCPVVVDPQEWACDTVPLTRPVPLVVHVPSNPVIKGSAVIEAALGALATRGLIEFRSITGVPHAAMRELYRGADIVVDQMRIGNYGVAAAEALAAGRVVVSHVDDQVRAAARQAAGADLPVVEANPDTLADVVAGLIADPNRARAVAGAGPGFVRTLHSGAAAARALEPFLTR